MSSPHGSSSKLLDRLRWSLCTEKIPLVGAHSSSARLDIPRILWSLKFYCRVHKRSPIFPNLNQNNPVHDFPPYSFTIHCYITLLSTSIFHHISDTLLYQSSFIWTPENIWWKAMSRSSSISDLLCLLLQPTPTYDQPTYDQLKLRPKFP